jgi:hypothetical protein
MIVNQCLAALSTTVAFPRDNPVFSSISVLSSLLIWIPFCLHSCSQSTLRILFLKTTEWAAEDVLLYNIANRRIGVVLWICSGGSFSDHSSPISLLSCHVWPTYKAAILPSTIRGFTGFICLSVSRALSVSLQLRNTLACSCNLRSSPSSTRLSSSLPEGFRLRFLGFLGFLGAAFS